jgi:hypothetical protein
VRLDLKGPDAIVFQIPRVSHHSAQAAMASDMDHAKTATQATLIVREFAWLKAPGSTPRPLHHEVMPPLPCRPGKHC